MYTMEQFLMFTALSSFLFLGYTMWLIQNDKNNKVVDQRHQDGLPVHS